MAETMEHHIVALLGKQHGSSGQLNPEPAVNGPLDLYLITVPCIMLRPEMAQQPPAAFGSIRTGVPRIDGL